MEKEKGATTSWRRTAELEGWEKEKGATTRGRRTAN
jgi:hypothetical protein